MLMLLSQAIENLIVATRAAGRSRETVVAYRRKLRPLLAFLGDVPVEAITTHDLRRYVVSQADQTSLYADHLMHDERPGRLSPYTIAGRVRALKRLFNWLVEEGAIETSPARRIVTPRPGRREPKAATMEDIAALLATAKSNSPADRRDRAIILLLADTGCRVGGLCDLEMSDANLDTRLVMLTEKGIKTRLVPLSDTVAAALQAWLEARPQDRGPWLFVGLTARAKDRLTPSGVAQMLKRRARLAGVTGRVNPHAFRHFFAREFLLAGGNLATLADLLGHSNIEVTKSSYAIFAIEDLREAHRRYSPVTRLEEQ